MSRAGRMGPALLALCLAPMAAACGEGDRPVGSQGTPSRPPNSPPSGLDEVAWGERLFQQYGCITCHQINGVRGVGGALDEIWGTERRLSDGTTVQVDAAYVRESIVDPDARLADGFPDRMIDYEGLLSDAQLDALVAYIRSLK